MTSRETAEGALDKEFHGMRVPEHMWGGMLRYVFEYCPTGEFLQAVISNDLTESVGRADYQ